jgi:predicted PurR-regulated permease PerM
VAEVGFTASVYALRAALRAGKHRERGQYEAIDVFDVRHRRGRLPEKRARSMLGHCADLMPEHAHRPVAVEVPWRTILKIICALALVWAWIQLYELVLLVIVAVLLSVALDPVVAWIEQRGLPRWAAAAAIGCTTLIVFGGFFYLSWSSLSSQAATVTARLMEFVHILNDRLPASLRGAFGITGGESLGSRVQPAALALIRGVAQAALVCALAFILTLYLVIEGARTLAWLLAFVPRARRARVQKTVVEARRVIFAYVAGNVVTSICAAVFVLITLSVLKVPAALLLGVLAGVCDFVPMLGFIVSSVPAVLLALTVSPATAIIVALCYVAYHLVENYWICPRVYGDQLELSNVAVVIAFAVGAELAGVVGALIALPLAAVYPAIERIWLREELHDTVEEHRAIEQERKAG